VGVRQEIGTMSHPVHNCNKTSALEYPYGLSMVTPFFSHTFSTEEPRKSPYKSRILPNGDLKIWKSPYLCIASDDPELRFEEPYFDFACLEAPPPAGEWFYTVCGNSYDTHSSFSDYWFVVVSTCVLGLGIYTQILCYPRTCLEVWGDILMARGLPMVHKMEVGSKENGELMSIHRRRSGVESGCEEYLVQRAGVAGLHWETRHEIETDGDGPVYAEGGGLYGHDGRGSSRERIQQFRHKLYAEERLQEGLWKECEVWRRQRNKQGTVPVPEDGREEVPEANTTG